MKIFKILKVAFVGFMAIGFIACTNDGSFKNSENLIPVIDCNTTGVTVPDDFTTLKSGDVIVKDVIPTVITTYHSPDDIKKICVVDGIAHLIRK